MSPNLSEEQAPDNCNELWKNALALGIPRATIQGCPAGTESD